MSTVTMFPYNGVEIRIVEWQSHFCYYFFLPMTYSGVTDVNYLNPPHEVTYREELEIGFDTNHSWMEHYSIVDVINDAKQDVDFFY